MTGRHEIELRHEEVAAICREHQVARLHVFGSVLQADFNPETSDIDFLVEFKPGVHKSWASEYLDIKEAFENLFKRKVDVLSEAGRRNRFLAARIDGEKELLYAA